MKIKFSLLPAVILLALLMSVAVRQNVYATSGTVIRVGVTTPSNDDVAQIIRNIDATIVIDVLNQSAFNNLATLSQYHAIFINCGSHGAVNTSVLRSYVEQGGIVYASDLAAATIAQAFPGQFSYATNTGTQTITSQIVHTSLASHMGITSLSITFNMGNWAVITSLTENATVYIRGNVTGHGDSPIAFSLDHGNGRVFFTSFHNHVQATSDMVNFIEYLIFRIRHIEAERNLIRLADEAGYVFDGMMFGTLNANETSPPFFYTPQANDFMLLFDYAMGNFTILLADPTGTVFSNEDIGILTEVDISPEDMQLAFYGFPVEFITSEMVVESLGQSGFRILNPLEGQWSFSLISHNPEPDIMFAVGLAERPVAALTRAMFAQVLANLESVDLSQYLGVAPTFFDSPPSAWFFAAVEWAARQDIVIGIGNNNFAPNSPLTREQMTTMLYHYAAFRNVNLPVLRTDRFADHLDVSYWALSAVDGLFGADIVEVRPNGLFQPQATATTPEIATIFMNFLPLLETAETAETAENQPIHEYDLETWDDFVAETTENTENIDNTGNTDNTDNTEIVQNPSTTEDAEPANIIAGLLNFGNPSDTANEAPNILFFIGGGFAIMAIIGGILMFLYYRDPTKGQVAATAFAPAPPMPPMPPMQPIAQPVPPTMPPAMQPMAQPMPPTPPTAATPASETVFLPETPPEVANPATAPPDKRICKYCGAESSASTMFCNGCGNKLY
ncbi:MAG: S-layer homology domain-containing protein [Defluviitaleaceae bacterium]|nr:S-layer homology domain-containing protein [Defluviitaleaceae bacterium]